MLEMFGKKVRQLREEQGITREECCRDESEISVRQLGRIETGTTSPSLLKVSYIAMRLGMSVEELVENQQLTLPERYKEIKYTILRVPIYTDEKRIAEREALFDEIFEHYYTNLPEEESLMIDCLQATMDVMLTQTIDFGEGLLEEYLDQVKRKNTYRMNDLVLLRLYILCYARKVNLHAEDKQFIKELLDRLLVDAGDYSVEESFIVASILSLYFSLYLPEKRVDELSEILNTINTLTEKTQDFHQKCINYIREWKYALFCLGDKAHAKGCYRKALMFAHMTNDSYLDKHIQLEWEKDT